MSDTNSHAAPSRPVESETWVCGRCGVGQTEHSLSATECVWEPSLAAPASAEPERLAQTPKIRAIVDLIDSLAQDGRMDNHAWEEIRAEVEDIPECESYTAIPHDEHGAEPREDEREACGYCGRTPDGCGTTRKCCPKCDHALAPAVPAEDAERVEKLIKEAKAWTPGLIGQHSLNALDTMRHLVAELEGRKHE